jgi:hypothetical protein
MRQVGLSTVARWLSEPLAEGVQAYMQSGGCLYRLQRVEGRAGILRVILFCKGNTRYTMVGGDSYTVNSHVFLHAGDKFIDGIEVGGADWAELGATPASVNTAGTCGCQFNVVGAAGRRGGFDGHLEKAVSLSTPCHPHCG